LWLYFSYQQSNKIQQKLHAFFIRSYIYTNISDEKGINNAGITIYDISDNLPVFVNLKLHHPNQQKIKPKFRCMKHFDPNAAASVASV